MIHELSETLAVFSAIFTPVVLISACGTFTLSTSNRLNRAVDRSRSLSDMIEKLATGDTSAALYEVRRKMLFSQLTSIIERAGLLHQALTSLYLALAVLIATSVMLGIVAVVNSVYAWLPLLVGAIGIGLMFYASLLLILETRIARAAIRAEMNFELELGRHYAPADFEELLKVRRRHFWRR